MARFAWIGAWLAAALLAGCQSHATLRQSDVRQAAAAPADRSSDLALYRAEPDQRAVLLAFDATGVGQVKSMPGDPPQWLAAAPMRYRTYLVLRMPPGEGKFEVGLRTGGGQTQATFWSYNEREELALSGFAIAGTIEAHLWPTGRRSSPGRWWVVGRYDLQMGYGIRLTGRFRARQDDETVARFARNRKL